MDEMNRLITYYLAFLRAIGITHQNSHWLSAGENFYGNHLLHERNYKSISENIDQAHERFIGILGMEALDPKAQIQMIAHIVNDFSTDDLIANSTKIEEKFLEVSKKLYDAMKEEGELTQGIDDLLLSIASQREEALYLLRSVKREPLGGKSASRKKLLSRMIFASGNTVHYKGFVIRITHDDIDDDFTAHIHRQGDPEPFMPQYAMTADSAMKYAKEAIDKAVAAEDKNDVSDEIVNDAPKTEKEAFEFGVYMGDYDAKNGQASDIVSGLKAMVKPIPHHLWHAFGKGYCQGARLSERFRIFEMHKLESYLNSLKNKLNKI